MPHGIAPPRLERSASPAEPSASPGARGYVSRTRRKVKVVDIVLDAGVQSFTGLEPYGELKGLVWLRGAPIGFVDAPVVGGVCDARDLRRAIIATLAPAIARQLVGDALAAEALATTATLDELLAVPPASAATPDTLVTVAVCTRDRADSLAICLESLRQLDYPHVDIIVVDNAPRDDATERLVREHFPQARYVREPRPGLDWARNRAIVEARGEIVAFTDDDCIVHPGWARALARAFQEPHVGAVTGLIVPYELDTDAQQLFELNGGFGRGFQRRWFNDDTDVFADSEPTIFLGAGRFGSGANMAYRRALFDDIGGFDPALDVGTVTNGGGDLEMFFRVLKEGYVLLYEPAATVRHRHRADFQQLRTQIANNGVGFYAYLARCAAVYRDERWRVSKVAIWWLWWWNIRRLLGSYLWPRAIPRELIAVELRGSLTGMWRYARARRRAAALAADVATYGPPPALRTSFQPTTARRRRKRARIAVRTVELAGTLTPLTDVRDYAATRVVVLRQGEPVGDVLIVNDQQPITVWRLRAEIAQALGLQVFGMDSADRMRAQEDLARSLVGTTSHLTRPDAEPRLSPEVTVSVVFATIDRPHDLVNCLNSLLSQDTDRQIEIIVVDNHPASGITPAVLDDYPTVKLVSEPRQGSSYARNAGFAASTGDIVVATDDDVTLPPDWLEQLIAPFCRPDVMVVTGNTLPKALETDAQRRFEEYGGLGRGFERVVAGRALFERFKPWAVPTWTLGGTANIAMRATIFTDPEIGLLDEALGPGTPTGVGEDTYLFYKVLKAGYSIVYEPRAYAWHEHRREDRALRRQIYNYSKGHVAYHLTTVLQDGDLRGLVDLSVRLPAWHALQVARTSTRALKGWRRYPLRLIVAETTGNLMGPISLLRSRRRVRRLGRSAPYVPVSERHAAGISPNGAAGQPPGPRSLDTAYGRVAADPARLERATPYVP